MSVQPAAAAREPIPPYVPPHTDLVASSTFDARWAAWVERGRQHDRAVARTLRIALLGAAVAGVVSILVFGLASGAR
jgi:hypothetical protein